LHPVEIVVDAAHSRWPVARPPSGRQRALLDQAHRVGRCATCPNAFSRREGTISLAATLVLPAAGIADGFFNGPLQQLGRRDFGQPGVEQVGDDVRSGECAQQRGGLDGADVRA
jgi:hypothetical protein